MASGAVISIQDMGAAGLTCSAVEMGDKGGLGVELDLDAVPCREDAMSAYEMMLSESQERMLMVLNPAQEAEAKAIFDKWDLDFAIVGHTIAEDRFLIRHGGEIKADLPLKALSGTAPEYDRPWVETPPAAPLGEVPSGDPARALLALMGTPNLCSRAGDGRHGGAAGRGRGGGAGAWDGQGAGLHIRRDAALLQGEPGRGRQAGGGGSLP
jgi:phosphoribosylformylglycinamidine synthase